MLHKLIDINPVSCLAAKRTVIEAYIKLKTFSPVLEPSLISEYLRTSFAFESYVVKHVSDHVYYSNLFELVPAMWTQSIAATLPLINAAFAG